MARRPRLGFYCPGAGVGGPWRYLHSILAADALNEFDVTIFSDLDGPYAPRPEACVVPLSAPRRDSSAEPAAPNTPLAKRSLPRSAALVAGFLQSSRRLARLFQAHRLDLLHTQSTGCEEAPFAARLAGIPRIVGTFHTDPTYDLHGERNGPAHHLLERLSNSSLTAAIAVSEETGRAWRRRTFLPRSRVTVIHNGIDGETFERRQSRHEARLSLNLPPDRFLIAGLGRLEEAKGFAHLIDAAAQLPGIPLSIAIAGDGPLRPALEAHARSRGVELRLLGYQGNVQPLLDAADLFALPSLCEACPFALLEAMAAGLPAVASNVGGVREILTHGECGQIVPARDSYALAAAIATIAGNVDRRERWGQAARERVQNCLSESGMVRETIALYCRLLERPCQ